MYLAQVTGTVVSTTKHSSLNGMKLLLVTRLDEHMNPTQGTQVAVDTVGAGNGEIVIVATGSSARMTNSKEHSVIDAVIDAAIVDATERSEDYMLTQQHPTLRDLDGWIAQAITSQTQPECKALTVYDFALLAQLAQETASAIHLAIVVSLVDAHGHPRYFVSMDNALLVSPTASPDKKPTAP